MAPTLTHTLRLFWATWCPHCKTLAPVVRSLRAHAARDYPGLRVELVDDKALTAKMTADFKVEYFPTLVLIDHRREAYTVLKPPAAASVDEDALQFNPKSAEWKAELQRADNVLGRFVESRRD